MKLAWWCAALAFTTLVARGQVVADRDYRPAIAAPRYAPGAGPVVCVDAAHSNFHTIDERFFAFGDLLRRDGYRVVSGSQEFDASVLAACGILVISNALSRDPQNRAAPAFTAAEIAAVHDWVRGGGALLLIADHMPFGRAASGLAAAFEVQFTNGFAIRDPESDAPDLFRRADRTLRDHPITRGRTAREAVSSVQTFTGQAFQAPRAQALLVFPAGYASLEPAEPWQFEADTPRTPVQGRLQGAVQEEGKGRAAFFGEAAMFTAQRAGPAREPTGMNASGAGQNFQLVLNLLHWLDRTL